MRLDGGRVAPVAVALTGLGSAVLGSTVGREGAVAGALLAVALVLLFFWTGSLPLLLVGGDLSLAGIGFLVLMMTYALRLVALVVALTLAARSEAVDVRWLAGTLIAGALVWVIAQAAAAQGSGSSL